jgi:hypothetical protein
MVAPGLFAILKHKRNSTKTMKYDVWGGTDQHKRLGDLRFLFKYRVRLALATLVMLLLLPAVAHALTTLSQGFSTSDNLPMGSIVSLKDGTTDQVVSASTKNASNLLGVVINNDSSLLSLSSNSKNQVQVATSGTATVLVSDINGEVEQGDEITASPIKGVGMKATDNAKVVGVAQGNMTADSNNKQQVEDENGHKQTVTLGEVPTQVNVSYYYAQPQKTIIPAALQNIANSFAGKKVETLPIIISAVVFVITLIVVVSIIYSMIRSSIISVGRNPMAQSAVYRDVIQLSALVLGILAVALVVIYLVLTRL